MTPTRAEILLYKSLKARYPHINSEEKRKLQALESKVQSYRWGMDISLKDLLREKKSL